MYNKKVEFEIIHTCFEINKILYRIELKQKLEKNEWKC